MAENKGSGAADSQPDAVNESAAIGLDDLTQALMGNTGVVTEADAESEQADAEVEDAKVAESDEEAVEQDVSEEELEEESEEESEDDSEDESQEVSVDVQKKIDKRIGRLTARAKDAEERAREVEEKLDDARTELEEFRDQAEKPAQVVSDNPHANIRTLKDLKEAKTKARELRAWCRRHRDGTTVTVNGTERDYDSSQIAELELKAQEDLEDHLPAREEFIKGEQEQSSTAEKAFPWWRDKSSSEYQAAMSVLRDAPMIRQLPNWKATVAFYLMGVNQYQQQMESAKKPKSKAKAKAPTKVTTRPAKAPAPIADTSSARYEEARTSFGESGSTEALANMFAVK
jgi:hypothetical protein|tara:strand:- start:687 stop:1718 length:1032 start_codon:yes stop_codon:yes gene_type:complete